MGTPDHQKSIFSATKAKKTHNASILQIWQAQPIELKKKNKKKQV
jgi:hypothetical protein